MYKDFWDLAKDLGEVMLAFAETQYHLRLHNYYTEVLDHGRKNKKNVDVCHSLKFVVSSRAKSHGEHCGERDVRIQRGECVRDLEKINQIIKTLQPDGVHQKVNIILDFDVAIHTFVYNYVINSNALNISVKDVEQLHSSDVDTIKRFMKEISKIKSDDYPLDLINLVKKLRK